MPPKRQSHVENDGGDYSTDIRHEHPSSKRRRQEHGSDREAKRVAQQAFHETSLVLSADEHRDSEDARNGTNEGSKPKKSTADSSATKSQDKKKGKAKNPNCKVVVRKTKTELNKELMESNEKLQLLQKEYSTQAQQFQGLKEKRLAGNDHGKDFVQDDRTIRENLSLMSDMIANWAHEWARRGFLRQHLSEADAMSVTTMLRGESFIPDMQMLWHSAAEAFTWMPNGFRTTTEAVLSHRVCFDIIARRYHFVGPSSNASQAPTEASLEELFRCMNKQLPDTQIWSSSTLRSLYASYQYTGPVVERLVDDEFAEPRDCYYKELAQSLLDSEESPLRNLMIPCETSEANERRKDLFKIFRTAGKISLQLWVQNAKVEVFNPLDGEFSRAQHIFSDHTEPNPLMKVNIELDLESIAIDFVHQLGIIMVRFETNDRHGKRMIAAKTSVSALADGRWKDKKQNFIEPLSCEQTIDSPDGIAKRSIQEQCPVCDRPLGARNSADEQILGASVFPGRETNTTSTAEKSKPNQLLCRLVALLRELFDLVKESKVDDELAETFLLILQLMPANSDHRAPCQQIKSPEKKALESKKEEIDSVKEQQRESTNDKISAASSDNPISINSDSDSENKAIRELKSKPGSASRPETSSDNSVLSASEQFPDTTDIENRKTPQSREQRINGYGMKHSPEP